MPAIVISLLLAAVPAQPPQTWKGVLCAHDPKRNLLVGRETYYSYGAAQVWLIGKDTLTLIDPKRLAQAQGKPFYVSNAPVVVNGKTYRKYGLPRVLTVQELEANADAVAEGVPFFRARGGDDQILYALSQAFGCEFQPYALTP